MTDVEELKTLLDLIKFEATTINTIWSFYITAAVAVAGWIASAGKDRAGLMSDQSRIIIATAFGAFTAINALSLSWNYGHIDAFLRDASKLMPTVMSRSPETAKALVPLSDWYWGEYAISKAIGIEIFTGALVCLLILRFGKAASSAGNKRNR